MPLNRDGTIEKRHLQEWANRKTDEQFTAVHFATFHSNMDMVKILVEEMHCDITTKNVYGANVLHVAAQGEAPVPLWYFHKTKHLSLEERDFRGSTPLHWATYSKSVSSLLFILAMKPDLEA